MPDASPPSEISVALILGLLVSLYGAYEIFHAYRSSDWPSVQGRILEVGGGSGGDGECTRTVKYEYPIPLITNEGKVSISCDTPYLPGQIVPVYYHPDNPKKTELEPGDYPSGIWKLLIGLIMMRLGYTSKPDRPDASNHESETS